MNLASEWDRCKGWIEQALAHCHGTHEIDDVLSAVLRGEATFVPGRKSAMVVEIEAFPRKRVLRFWLAGGDMGGGGLEELRDVLRPMVEEWAKAQGCSMSRIEGRPGWARALPGYERVATVSGKEL